MARKKQNSLIDSPRIFIIILLMFIGSLALVVFSIINKGEFEENLSNKSEVNKNNSTSDVSLNEYFDEEAVFSADDPYIKSDPFRKQCAPVSGDDAPSVAGFTVCSR